MTGEDEDTLREEFLTVDIKSALSEYDDRQSCQGYEVDVSKLPKEVKMIRFTNCW